MVHDLVLAADLRVLRPMVLRQCGQVTTILRALISLSILDVLHGLHLEQELVAGPAPQGHRCRSRRHRGPST